MLMRQWRRPLTCSSNSALLWSFWLLRDVLLQIFMQDGEMCISDLAVRKWVRIFKGEDPRETILRDRKRSGRPLSASVTAHREKVDCIIRANRRVKLKEIANAVCISKERVHHIVTTVLGYRKVSAR
ncbi:histone-lysine N-methyltransferase SETMAR-like protein [Plakobranchus ocellatus]|uniref:Histone-lysine N-methyltransferase SETMAR-like protein n=1 Tax=Plakobranchus ocellatus TaxID=259542 RepID=A0AAV4CDB8_9GAST|nr:histone-lysine N-methyltransferase SETMAR-like protein [Plakobranchus ocellatus]